MPIQKVVSSLVDAGMVELKGIHLVRDMVRKEQDQILISAGTPDDIEYRETECESCGDPDVVDAEGIGDFIAQPHWHFEASGWSKE